MNGKGLVLQANALNFPIQQTEKETKTVIFEEIQIEKTVVSEIETKTHGTRFARLKRALRKRSASIL